MIAFCTLITSTIILITNVIGCAYDIIAKKHQRQQNEYEALNSFQVGMQMVGKTGQRSSRVRSMTI